MATADRSQFTYDFPFACQVRAYLESVSHFHQDSRRPAGWRWNSPEDLVLSLGRAWSPAPLPAGIEPMAIKQCFTNAYLLAARRSDLTYVEGYAAGVIPVHHAWCVDRLGNVVDPTWASHPRTARGLAAGTEYMGIPFKTSWLKTHVRRCLDSAGVWGVLSSYAGSPACRWPCMRLRPQAYLSPAWIIRGTSTDLRPMLWYPPCNPSCRSGCQH